jgi:hypothetical protein
MQASLLRLDDFWLRIANPLLDEKDPNGRYGWNWSLRENKMK